MAIFEGRKSSNDVTNNDMIIDNEVVTSYVPPQYLFNKTDLKTLKSNYGQVFQNKAF